MAEETCTYNFVEFNEQEQALYNDIENWRGQDAFTSAFSSLTLKREACSSREAVYYSLKKHVEKRQKENEHYIKDPHIDVLMDKINHIPFNSKATKALELIKEIDDKVVIFTEYRASQMYLQWFYNNTVFLLSHSAADLNAGRKIG